MSTAEAQLSSGQQLSQISDDPAAAAQILALQSSIAQNAQYQRNGAVASDWLSSTDAALTDVNQLLNRAQGLAVQAANGTLSASDRQDMASEVNRLIGQAAQDGNTTYEGSYVFAGAQTNAAPFAATTGGVTYNNSNPLSATASLTRAIAPGSSVVVNTVGHDPTGGTGVFDAVFSALSGFYQALQSNNTAGIQASIQQLGNAQDTLSKTRAAVGGVMDQVNATQQQLAIQATYLAQYHSNLADADMAKAATDFSSASTTEQATLAAMGKSFPPSLFNYLT
jgi:flagellar hook-associated protein 3 FlgL